MFMNATISPQQKEDLACLGIRVWRKNPVMGLVWFTGVYKAYVERQRAQGKTKNIYDDARQWVFDTDPSSVKHIMLRLNPELTGDPNFTNADKYTMCVKLHKLLPGYDHMYKSTKEACERTSQTVGEMIITDVKDLITGLEMMGRELLDAIRVLERLNTPIAANVLFPLLIPLMFSCCTRICELCHVRPNHTNQRADFEMHGSGAFTQKNVAKGDSDTRVRPPVGKMALLDPELTCEMLDTWFRHLPNVSLKSPVHKWFGAQISNKTTKSRFSCEFTRWGLDKIVQPIGDYKIHLYSIRHLSGKCLPLIHDVSALHSDYSAACGVARQINCGHNYGSGAEKKYTAVRVDEATAFEPRRKKLKTVGERLNKLAVCEEDEAARTLIVLAG